MFLHKLLPKRHVRVSKLRSSNTWRNVEKAEVSVKWSLGKSLCANMKKGTKRESAKNTEGDFGRPNKKSGLALPDSLTLAAVCGVMFPSTVL